MTIRIFFLCFLVSQCSHYKNLLHIEKERVLQDTLGYLLNKIALIDANKFILYSIDNEILSKIDNEINLKNQLQKNKSKLKIYIKLISLTNKNITIDLKKLYQGNKLKFLNRDEWGNKSADYSIINGSLIISDIVFDTQKKIALFALHWLCKGDCGGKYLVFMQKGNTSWEIEEIIILNVF